MNSKPLDQAYIQRDLKTRCFGHSLRIVDECASTNDLAQRMAEDGAPHGSVIIAESQHAGRGRLGRTWYSPIGGVWLTIIVRPSGVPSLSTSLPVVCALGIAKVLAESLGVNAGVRWPNDVEVNRRKIAGVLVESKSKGDKLNYALLGLGINVNFDTDLFEQIRGSSTSLSNVIGSSIDRENLIVKILTEMEAIYELVQASQASVLMAYLRKLDCSRGRHVRVATGQRVVVGVFDDYEALDRVRIATHEGPESVETSAVVSVDYESD
jgi:BirA family transcriptional regulator, biotin operon repressor / biotin---[acetyl-CoA-carboxylase] ligase